MKKVFSVEKFKERCKEIGLDEIKINNSLIKWANKCDGLTTKEMHKLDYGTIDEWMIEVEERK